MIRIEKATPAEAELITALGTKTFLESHGNSAAPGDIRSYVSKNFTKDVFESALNDPENIFHVIYFEGQAVGYSKIVFNKPQALITSSAITKLERLYLLKNFYALKLGSTLFEFIIDLSKNAAQEGIWLFVWIKNQRAVQFYQKKGFEIIGNFDFKISETHSNPNYIMYLKY